jgi:hypothetical protein
MTRFNSTHLMMLSAAIVLAGCSSAAQEAPDAGANIAIVTQDGPGHVASIEFGPAPEANTFVEAAPLDGAPPPLTIPEAVAPQQLAPAPVAPKHAPAVKPAPVKASFTCDIDIDRTSHGIRVTPVVRANRSLSGEYTLVITKDGSGGSSDISQGGPFDAARGEKVRLGSSEFSMARGASFRAVLKVRADGREICRDVRS